MWLHELSGSGKTQFLFSLLLAVQLAKPHGLQKQAIYISTEHPLSTSRLSQLLECHPALAALPEEKALRNILSINAMDLETQDHILNYQLPVAIARHNVGLVVIDSITSNYRAEHTSNNMLALSARTTELARLGQMLRNMAAKEDVAIVVANQVSDRFDMDGNVSDSTPRPGFPAILSQGVARDPGADSPAPASQAENPEPAQYDPSQPDSTPSSTIPSSPCPAPEDDQFDGSYLVGSSDRNETLSLLHQERFFTGWGDTPQYSTAPLKNPALGFFWSTQIACRIALKKETAHSTVVPWDDMHQFSTPRDQTDPDEPDTEQQAQESRPGFASARVTHETETEAGTESNASNGNEKPEVRSEKLASQKPPPATEREHVTRRTMKLAFAPWTVGPTESHEVGTQAEKPTTDPTRREVDFEIWKGGLRAFED